MILRSASAPTRHLPAKRRLSAIATLASAVVGAAALHAGASETLNGTQPGGFGDGPDDRKTRVSFVTEHEGFVAGSVNYLGVRIEIADGWHVYWPGQNETGFPLTAEWSVSGTGSGGGAEIKDAWLWPAPERYISPGDILDHVFEHEVLVMVPVAVPADASGELTIDARLDWLVCREVCLFEGDDARLTIPIVQPGQTQRPTDAKPAFDRAKKRHAKSSGDAVRVEREGATLTVTAHGASRLAFYPDSGSVRVSNLLAEGVRDRGSVSLELAEPVGTVSGIVETWDANGQTTGLYRIRDPKAEPAGAGNESENHQPGE